jgi:sugar phosphate isomerase/epimerase
MHGRISINALCFPGEDLPTIAGYWCELGARRIGFPSTILPDDLSEAKAVIQSGGRDLESVVHLLFTGRDLEAPDEVWAEEQAQLSRVIAAVAELGGKSVYLLTGGRGGLSWEGAAERFCGFVAPAAAQAKAAGLNLLIEPATAFHADLHFAHTLRDTVLLAEMAGIGVNMDIFGCWTEAGLTETIERAAPRLHLIQVADYVFGDRSLPCRAVPGDGAIPLKRIFDGLLSAGYEGVFDLELIGPRIDAEGRVAACRRGADNISEILDSLGA